MTLLVRKKKRAAEHLEMNGSTVVENPEEPKRYPQWHGRTLEEQKAVVASITGSFAHIKTSADDFARRKQEEIDLEEAKFRR